MKIAEIPSHPQSKEQEQQEQSQFRIDPFSPILLQIESAIKQAELLSSAADCHISPAIPADLRHSLTLLAPLTPFPNSIKLRILKLGIRLWKVCTNLSNTSAVRRSSTEHANLGYIVPNLFCLAFDEARLPSPAVTSAWFYYNSGLLWHNIKNFEVASWFFERASDTISKMDLTTVFDASAKKLLLDLNIARSRTAWKVCDRNLAVALLSGAKDLMFGSPEHYKALGAEYLTVGKMELLKKKKDALPEALKLMNEALDLFEKGSCLARAREQIIEFKDLRFQTLRFISIVLLLMKEFESVIKYVTLLRDGDGGDNHPNLPVLAMKAWLGLGRHGEAEKELRGIIENKGIPESVCVSAVGAYFEAVGGAGAEPTMGVVMGLLDRCHVSAGAAVRVAQKVVGHGGGEVSEMRAKVASKLVSDERVLALFRGEAAAEQRKTMCTLLWNCAVDHFQSKGYKISAEMFEKSMLYIPYNLVNRNFRAKVSRFLCLCYLGLSQLDRAQEYVNEAEMLESNINCAVLKLKISLLKNDNVASINQIQFMMSCHYFTPDFLSLSTHEAVACRAFPVTVASFSSLLDLYSTGKSMPLREVVIHHILVKILTQESSDDSEILRALNCACDRAIELGTVCFFGEGEVGKTEQNWFAVACWNFGARIGKERKFELCAEFLQLASKFYCALVDEEKVEENNALVFTSLTLVVDAMIFSEGQTKTMLTNAKTKEAKEMLDRARKIMILISTENQVNNEEAHRLEVENFIHIISAYDILGRLNDSRSQQLVVKRYASSKVCNSKYLLRIGLSALQGPRFNREVANFALNECLSALLSSQSPNYQNVALVFRKLISITSISKSDAHDNAIYEMYRRAYRIMAGLKEGEYPMEEGKWLAITAWTRAFGPITMRQSDMANKWLNLGLEIARHGKGMETSITLMEELLNSSTQTK